MATRCPKCGTPVMDLAEHACGEEIVVYDCPTCKGDGYLGKKVVCPTCGGSGKTYVKKKPEQAQPTKSEQEE